MNAPLSVMKSIMGNCLNRGGLNCMKPHVHGGIDDDAASTRSRSSITPRKTPGTNDGPKSRASSLRSTPPRQATPGIRTEAPANHQVHGPDLSNASPRDPHAVPEIAHWFWTGNPMSQDNLSNIIDFARHNPHHKLNLWTDKAAPLHRALIERGETLGFSLLDRIEVRNHAEAFEGDWVGITSRQKTALQSIVGREINGTYSNPAAASDVVRLAVLYRFGGAYFDADVKFSGPVPSGLTSPRGLLLDIRPDRKSELPNSVMAAAPGSEVVGKLLKTIVDIYACPASENRAQMQPAERAFHDAADLARRGTSEHKFVSEYKSKAERALEDEAENDELAFDFLSMAAPPKQTTAIRPLTQEEQELKSREALSMENPATWQLKREYHLRSGQSWLLERKPRDAFTVMATGPVMIHSVLREMLGPDYSNDESMRIKNDFFVQAPAIGTFADAKDEKPRFMNEV